MNMKYSLLTTVSIVIFLSACKNKSKEQTAPVLLQGRYVNQTFLDKNADSMNFATPGYCFQLVFVDGNKVFVDRGFEGDTLYVGQEKDRLSLLKATFNGDLPILPDADGKGLVLLDSSVTGKPYVSRFVKVEDQKEGVPTLVWMVNEQMVAGTYTLHEKGASTDRKVSFLPSGSVSGLDGFDSYTLCFTGDCMQTTLPYFNTLTLSGPAGKSATYAYSVDKGKSKLSLYAIEDPIPDTKGERKVKDLVFDLRKN